MPEEICIVMRLLNIGAGFNQVDGIRWYIGKPFLDFFNPRISKWRGNDNQKWPVAAIVVSNAEGL